MFGGQGGYFLGTEGSAVQRSLLWAAGSEGAVTVTLVAEGWWLQAPGPRLWKGGRVAGIGTIRRCQRATREGQERQEGCSLSGPSKAGSEAPKLGSCRSGRSSSQEGGWAAGGAKGGRLALGAAPHSCLPSWVPTHRAGWMEWGRMALYRPLYPQFQRRGIVFWGRALPLPLHTTPSLHLPPSPQKSWAPAGASPSLLVGHHPPWLL